MLGVTLVEQCQEYHREEDWLFKAKPGSQGPISRVYVRVPVTSWKLVRKLWVKVEREVESAGVELCAQMFRIVFFFSLYFIYFHSNLYYFLPYSHFGLLLG